MQNQRKRWHEGPKSIPIGATGHEAIADGEKDAKEKDTCGQRFMVLIDR